MFFKTVNNKSGAIAIIMAMMIVVIATTLVAYLPNQIDSFAKANQDAFVKLALFNIAEEAAKVAITARANGYRIVELGGGNCSDEGLVGGQTTGIGTAFRGNFCFKGDPNGGGWDINTEQSLRCFDDIETRDQTEHNNDHCIDLNNLEVKTNLSEPIPTVDVIVHQSLKQRIYQTVMNHLVDLQKSAKENLNFFPQANAVRNMLPPDPATASPPLYNTRMLGFTNCSSITPDESHMVCQWCTTDPVGVGTPPPATNDNATCIRIRVCMNSSAGCAPPANAISQRVIVFGPTSDLN